MSRQPNWGILLRVFPLIIAVVAIIVMKQRCGDSTAKMFDVVTESPTAPPNPEPKSPTGSADLSAPR